jgi:hypothetical protein
MIINFVFVSQWLVRMSMGIDNWLGSGSENPIFDGPHLWTIPKRCAKFSSVLHWKHEASSKNVVATLYSMFHSWKIIIFGQLWFLLIKHAYMAFLHKNGFIQAVVELNAVINVQKGV